MGENSSRVPGHRRQIYVEIGIRTSMDRLWRLSQDAELHPRWDLRFSRIVPAAHSAGEPQRFRYEFGLPFHTITGTGISLGHRHREDGQSTSVLRFSTSDPLSPIGSGSGYWRYIPTQHGIRFITGYTYQPGMGVLRKALDRRVTRPALGWATALSFDRLRLWAELGVDPRDARTRWILDAVVRAGGVAAGSALLLSSAGRPEGAPAAVVGLAIAAASLLVPAHRTVPRARRCLRRAPDRRSAKAPSALAGLPAPRVPDAGREPAVGGAL